jgi:SAM-dependent methyltransferase
VERTLEPEWLDELPPDDPKAVRSRRDLKRLNWWMRHESLVADALLRYSKGKSLQRVVDLGAGDGTFALGLTRKLVQQHPKVQVLLVDRQPCMSAETREGFQSLGCTVETVASDIFDWLTHAVVPSGTVFIANLFLHHFHEAELCEMFYLASKQVDLFAACEPRRAELPLRMAKLVGLIGCNSVTRHDAVVSVRAGFTKRELSDMWPTEGAWLLQEQHAGLFSHLFVAHRK